MYKRVCVSVRVGMCACWAGQVIVGRGSGGGSRERLRIDTVRLGRRPTPSPSSRSCRRRRHHRLRPTRWGWFGREVRWGGWRAKRRNATGWGMWRIAVAGEEWWVSGGGRRDRDTRVSISVTRHRGFSGVSIRDGEALRLMFDGTVATTASTAKK